MNPQKRASLAGDALLEKGHMEKRKRKLLRLAGVCMIAAGGMILAFFGYRKISRELYLKKLLESNTVLEIPALHIKVPVLEGTDSKALEVSAGHFEGCGTPGHSNYCLAGHNSTIYAEIFNDLDQIQIGNEIFVTETDGTSYCYVVSDYQIIAPTDTQVLHDFGDDRITVISCTDDGQYRQMVVGMLQP